MQKFVVKKSKSAPLASSSSQPAIAKPILSADEKTVPQNAPATNSLAAKPKSPDSVAVCTSDVIVKQPATKSATPTPASHVKMSGYLKKKRNVSAKSAVDILCTRM